MQKLHHQGRGVHVDGYLRVKGMEGSAWALGDCTQSSFAPTAQVASQQGLYVARQLNDLAAATLNHIDVSPVPFAYHHKATLAYIGDDRGVSDVRVPFWDRLISIKGYQSYVLWRSAYLSNTFTLRNKLLVAFDWTKEKVFGRDISRE
ncbi:NADH:ubiquinone oxidoreductase [Coelomomyces lativittatus]|nr:NADH:ubiquinone oxidoreductase [Coelomomyces lativittatus]